MIYHIFANKSNIGDWLSAKGIQSTLSKYPLTELFCDLPFVDDTIHCLRSLKTDDFVIIGGGGLFMDYFTPFWEAFLEISDSFRYGIWGVGYCDITHQNSLPPSKLIEEIVQRSLFFYARDNLTCNHLIKLRLAPPVSCPSLLCFPGASHRGNGLLHVDNYTTVGSEAFDYMDNLSCKIAADSGRNYRRTNNRIQSGNETELHRCLELYRDSDIILSSALHGCVVGVAFQKKVIAVSGDRKINSFMQAVGLGDWVCDNDDLAKLPILLDNIDGQPSCDQRVKKFRRSNEEIGQKLRTLLDQIHANNR